MSQSFDVVVIGGGPGGYNAAIRAAQLGLSVACIEKRPSGRFGGTCLNVGCIPSKAMLHASEAYAHAKSHLKELGVKVSGVELDLPAMLGQKDDAVQGLTDGIAYLFKKNKVTGLKGHGRIEGPGKVILTDEDGKEEPLSASTIVIATGSSVMSLPNVEIDEDVIVSSTGALELKKVPDHMVVVGGGYIGLEMGSVWRRLGAKVTVVEYLDRITPGMDGEVSKQFMRILKKQGMEFKLGTKVTGIEKTKQGATLSLEPAAGGEKETLEADVVLIAIGRKPHTEGLGLDTVGIKTNDRGFIPVDDHYQTGVDGIYAIGDVTPGPMLAHKAEDEAVAVAEIIAGKGGHVNYDVIPGVVYTDPEVAMVGKTEEQLKDEGVAYKVGKFPFTANSRAKTNHETDGFVKVLADAETDKVLGVHMIGTGVGEMIAEACLVMEFGGSSEDIARTCHPHPTRTEALRQAAMGVEGWTMQA
ncbi:2-oxoglutarate dehydrogenase, E3 component, lipoamide dehydrogenase [Parvularcula bermudensis HTCC2503]|uniref:Dihydrolipoyl dehydrogenase n=1 Tax=Parvularcula bermudensis (strain ATCC BAA-594 / HTCC2503 / KCTC 12087) TaxID=314260 RepID=E0TCF0_PARBH|nr:dihydrolipoyl dehydrogenase [Parvularcula bermudensis]ADM09840.1 2-oxoglutarate dehydrogenase, E3 component, lipoamide dehydrogenase [Parvularcula bermudensis HTCC2503]